MEIRHAQGTPWVDPEAYVAPTAVLSGQVRVGPGSCVLHSAVLSADGGAVEIGAQMRTAMRRYARFLARSHQGDVPVR